jgi:peptide deformylase
MAIKRTVQAGNPVIRAVAGPIEKISSAQTQKIIQDLTDTMRACALVGIAAPQIGISKRIFISEIRAKNSRGAEADSLRVFINPVITWTSKKKVSDWEGCGSVANSNLFAKVKRPESVTVTAQNENGELFVLKASGLLARIIQHEVDHLNGILFTDTADRNTYMSSDEYMKMRKLERKIK